MKKVFISIIITFICAIAVVLGIGLFKESDYVAKSRSSVEVNQVWRVALASYVNEKKPEVLVDGTTLPQIVMDEVYMSDSLNLMFSENGIRDAFGCAVSLYDGSRLLIEKGNAQATLLLNDPVMEMDGKEIALNEPATRKDDMVYIPAEVVEKGFQYLYNWNVKDLRAEFTGNPQMRALPSYYNLAESGRLSYVKDQASLGACWAFAALGAVESTLLPEEEEDLSEDHLLHHSGFGLDPEEGGDYIMALAYLSSWKGPVREEDDPYGDGESDASLSAVRHVQEVRMIESKDYETIKKMVFTYGAVESSVYMALLDENTIDDRYYNGKTHAYCYPMETQPNHEIVIIGWDDAYPASSFQTPVSQNGAFICQNSWGDRFGENGIFYISYDDAVIGTCSEVYTRIEGADNYDRIYQYDDCGWIGRVGYNKNRAFFANVFTAQEDEELCAVSFYATGPDTSYKVYVDTRTQTEGDLSIEGEPLAEGTLDEMGYYTVKLQKTVPLQAGARFAVIVEINTPGSTHPIAMEMNAEDMRTGTVITEGKESYISNTGTHWERTQESSACNVCLKAFTLGVENNAADHGHRQSE